MGTRVSDNFRAAHGVEVPAGLPEELSSKCDIDGDGMVKGMSESRPCSFVLSRYLTDYRRTNIGIIRFAEHFPIVDVEKQQLWLYGRKVLIESEIRLSFDEFFEIGEGLRSYPAVLVKEAIGGSDPLRIVVADEGNWYWYAGHLFGYIGWKFVGIWEGITNHSYNAVYSFLDKIIYVNSKNVWVLEFFDDLTGTMRHEFGHYIAMKPPRGGRPIPDLIFPVETTDKAIQGGLGCYNFDRWQDADISDHTGCSPYVCRSFEALAETLEFFFEHEEILSKSDFPFDHYLDTVVRRFVDSGCNDLSVFEENPYTPYN